jgi:lipoprotein-anchoring transpeptidase ErfK/SrfK
MLLLVVTGSLLVGLQWSEASDADGAGASPPTRLEPVAASMQILYGSARASARESAVIRSLEQPTSSLRAGMRAGMRLAGQLAADTPIRESPDQPEPREVLPAMSTFGTPNTVLVVGESRSGDGVHWYEILLPRKPNGTRGWLRADSLHAYWVEHSIHIDVGDRKLSLFERGRLVKSFPVGVGRQATPTPRGDFFITVRLAPPNPGGPYGPLAMGLSAYSEVLSWWAGGGQAAIHGTNNPGGIGTTISNGCIRMHNADVLELGELSLLGTPVRITD